MKVIYSSKYTSLKVSQSNMPNIPEFNQKPKEKTIRDFVREVGRKADSEIDKRTRGENVVAASTGRMQDDPPQIALPDIQISNSPMKIVDLSPFVETRDIDAAVSAVVDAALELTYRPEFQERAKYMLDSKLRF